MPTSVLTPQQKNQPLNPENGLFTDFWYLYYQSIAKAIADLQASSSSGTTVDDGQFLNVKTFGAVGDGITDDGPAIQRAWDFGIANRCAIHFPPGVYLFSSTLYIHGSLCTYSEAGIGEGIAILNYTGSGDAVRIENAVAGTYVYAPVLRNLWIKPTIAATCGLRMLQVSGIILDRISVGGVAGAHFGIGMYFQQTGIAQIVRPVVSYCGIAYQFDNPPATFFDPNAHITFDGCDTFGGGSNQIIFDIRSVSNLVVNGLWVEDFAHFMNFDNTSVAAISVDIISVTGCYLLAGLSQTPRRIVNAVGAAAKPFQIEKLVFARNKIQLSGAVALPFYFAVTGAAFLSAAALVLRENDINGVGAQTSSTDAVTTSGSATLTSAAATFTAAMVGYRVRVTGSVDFETTIVTYTNAHSVQMADLASGSGTGLNMWVEGPIAYADSTIVSGEFINNHAIGDGAAWTPYDSSGSMTVAAIHSYAGNLGLGDSNITPAATVDVYAGRPDGITSLIVRAGKGQGFSAMAQFLDIARKAGLVIGFDGAPLVPWQKAITMLNDPAGGNRWQFSLSGGEFGANTGSNLALLRFDDTGSFLGAPMSFDRATGIATIPNIASLSYSDVLFTSRASSIGLQAFSGLAAGRYLISVYLGGTVTGPGTVLWSFSWTSGAITRTITSGTFTISAIMAGAATATYAIAIDASSGFTYFTTYAATGSYEFSFTITKL